MTLAGVGQESALLERAAELSALDAALDSGGRLVLLSGEAGVGKTVAAASFLRASHGGRAHPVGRLRRAVHAVRPRTAHRHRGGRAASSRRLVGRRRGRRRRWPPRCGRAGPARPGVVVLEDVHWADEATLDVLHRLGRREPSGCPALVVATLRDEQLPRAPRAARSAARRSLATAPGRHATGRWRRSPPGPGPRWRTLGGGEA